MTEEHYKKIQNYCIENGINAFGVEFGEIKKQYDEIKKQYDEIKKQWYSSVELTRAYLDRIAEVDREINAFVLVDEKGAMQAAEASDARRKQGRLLGALDGIPYAVKDNLCVRNMRTTCASKMLENYIAPYDATAVSRLCESGAVLLGKLNMDEFAMGSTGEHSHFGATANPRNTELVPGGSSSGSAAAVAALEAPFALGSDTGGSVRQPAAFCGVLGLKPTYGAVSRYGMQAFSSSLDCVGLVTRTAADAATLLEILMKKDPKDATSVAHPDPCVVRELEKGVRGLRIGVVSRYFSEGIDPSVRDAVTDGVKRLQREGAELQEICLPAPEQALLSYYAISAVEAASNLARYDGVRYGRAAEGESPMSRSANTRGAYLGSEVKRRILLGTALLQGDYRDRYYRPACHLREQISASLLSRLGSFDLLAMPTSPVGAFLREESISPLEMRAMDLCTVYANLTGLPAVSVPVGLDSNAMPVGLQLMAAPWREDLLLRGARALEKIFEEGGAFDEATL